VSRGSGDAVKPTRETDTPAHDVSFAEATRFWIKLGFINFGGPTGQIAIMHDELVERRRWITSGRFLHALNYCMLLPGPEATQLAIYVGWLLHKVRGGIVAGVTFVLPAFFLILGLSYVYVTYGEVPWVSGIFYGLSAAVIGLVAAAVIRIGARDQVDGEETTAISDHGSAGSHTLVSFRRSMIVLVVGLSAWFLPLLAVALWRGSGDTLTQEAWFFSKAAVVTFGGAYAVLAYINQAAVLQFHWLLPHQVVVGLGLAESTPGPLIMVTEFIGFVGAYQHPGNLDPVVAGVLGAVVVTWATFAPCFLWIFLGAPFIERLRGNLRLTTALTAVTAAVVGVILNLAVAFGIQTLFDRARVVEVFGGPILVPIWSSVDWFALAIAAISFVGLWRYRWNVVPVILASGVAGLIYTLAT
jgi:chromate transporter